MRRPVAIGIVMIGLFVAGCGGGDDSATAEPAPETATPSSTPSVSGLPPEFVACMAEQGYAIESADDVHAAPQAVLQVCFGALHESGGAP
jgi:hypothetical protein